MSEKRKVGPHEIWLESDSGFIVIVTKGMLLAEHAVSLMEFIKGHWTAAPDEPILILTDYRQGKGMTSEARQSMSNGWWQSAERVEVCSAMFGASFAVRTIISLLYQAAKLTSSTNLASTAVATEAEARAWLTEQGRTIRARSVKRS